MTVDPSAPALHTDPPLALEDALRLVREQQAVARDAVRLDLFKACALLALKDSSTARDYANAVVRTLGQALDKTPELRAPDADGVSFDEHWLLRVLERLRAQDDASVAFLISSRVPQPKRDSVIYLVTGLAETLRAA